MLYALICAVAALVTTESTAGTLRTTAGDVQIDPMITGLDRPWAVDFLPGGAFLVTERDGDLLHVAHGKATRVDGVPRVRASGQGGLLDVTIPRDFASSREVLLTYSKPQGGGADTALASGRLNAAGTALTELRILFEATGGGRAGRHFGSRVIDARDGTLFITIGDRGQSERAQDLGAYNGKIVRINRDGSVPADNPFVGAAGALPEIWSLGHRNPQGADMDSQGRIWTSEHGAQGGDEVNMIRKGRNYGWPIISYGKHYSGKKIGEGTSRQGLEQPEHYWDPSIAPSGLLVYSGRLWPDWRGDIFVGSLKFDYISRLDGTPLREAAQIKGPETERVRDIVEAPDGSIWFVSVGRGSIYRLSPAP
ncbi:PQQ-dependent sugar dehydrogenase [Sedimentitalea todarodis]|uniref:PQQ-dependent sugar dehydrogenase n=1 Tax=Sedimentitalea todarodis TaxID=1631240 RepID=A0ABU3VAT1_9RHOB|nr:PQQ-dependent sugar dehydrogenase [Sedimentitalea todarodis]MDU9003275.1 PQQ-dependent sugar dehydrogenase [Sedimentitalea todarodis]